MIERCPLCDEEIVSELCEKYFVLRCKDQSHRFEIHFDNEFKQNFIFVQEQNVAVTLEYDVSNQTVWWFGIKKLRDMPGEKKTFYSIAELIEHYKSVTLALLFI